MKVILRWVRTPSNHRQNCHCHCHCRCQTDSQQHPNNNFFDSTTSARVHLPRTGSSRTRPCSIKNTTFQNHYRCHLTCIGLANPPTSTFSNTNNKKSINISISSSSNTINQPAHNLYLQLVNSLLHQTFQTGILPQFLLHHTYGSAGTSSFTRTRSSTIILPLPPRATRNRVQYQRSQLTGIRTWPSRHFLPPDLATRSTNDGFGPRPTTNNTLPTANRPTISAASPQTNQALVAAQISRRNSYIYPSTALARTNHFPVHQPHRPTLALDGILKIASDTQLSLESPRPQMCR